MEHLFSCLGAAALAFLSVKESFAAPELLSQPLASNAPGGWTEIATAANITGVAYGNGVYLAGTDFGTVLISGDGAVWKHLPASEENGSMNAFVYGQGQWVAVGARGQIHTSSNGLSWTPQWSGTESHLMGITFSNDQFVVVGAQSSPQARTILTSRDAVHWTVRDLSIGQSGLWKVLYEKGLFVAVGGTIMASSRGRDWLSITNAARSRLSGIAYGKGQFVAVGDGDVLTSTNGIEWKASRSGAQNLFDLAYGADRFVATGDNSFVWTSTNGLNWVRSETGSSWPLGVITFGEGRFVAGGQNGAIAVSTNGLQWESYASGTEKLFSQVTLGEGRMVAINAGTLVTSENGSQWQAAQALLPYQVYNASFVNGQFIAFGLDRGNTGRQVLANSADGLVWNVKTFDLEATPAEIVFGNGLYVGVRDHFFASVDGTNWTITGAPPFEPLLGLAFGNGEFVAVRNARIYGSKDGRNWSMREEISDLLVDVAYGNGVFVAVGNGGVSDLRGMILAAVSSDGITWSIHPIPVDPNRPTSGLSSVVFGGGWFVAVGGPGTILSSRNGVDWNRHDPGSISSLSSVDYAAGRFIAVGNEGTVLQSESLPLLGIPRLTGNGIALTIGGNPNQVFAVESTPALGAQPWKELGRITNSVSESYFLDSAQPAASGFYRLLTVPTSREFQK